jgi:hypothetical protein
VLAGSVAVAHAVVGLGAGAFDPLRLSLEVQREEARLDELRRGFFAAAADRAAVARDVRAGQMTYAEGLARIRGDHEPTFRQALAARVSGGEAADEAQAERDYFDEVLARPGVPPEVLARFADGPPGGR